MSQISTVMNSNIIPFVVDLMPCEITKFVSLFESAATVTTVCLSDSPTESEKFLLEISFMYPGLRFYPCVGRRIFIYYRYYDQPISGLDIFKIQIYMYFSIVSHSRVDDVQAHDPL